MSVRMPGCRDCERWTSGDCGKHGPLVMPAQGEAQRATAALANRDRAIAVLRRLVGCIDAMTDPVDLHAQRCVRRRLPGARCDCRVDAALVEAREALK